MSGMEYMNIIDRIETAVANSSPENPGRLLKMMSSAQDALRPRNISQPIIISVKVKIHFKNGNSRIGINVFNCFSAPLNTIKIIPWYKPQIRNLEVFPCHRPLASMAANAGITTCVGRAFGQHDKFTPS